MYVHAATIAQVLFLLLIPVELLLASACVSVPITT